MPPTTRPERPLYRAPWFIFWVAFGLRLAVILIGRTYHQRLEDDHFNFGFEAGRIARSLVTGHGYANPFNGLSGPTAWLPPLYPLLLAGCFRLFGVYTNASAFAILALNSLFSALICPAVFEIAARIFEANGVPQGSQRTNTLPIAVWSAWLWAVYPAALQYAVHWVWEMSLTTCLFSWALVLALRMRGTGEAPGNMPVLVVAGTLARWIVLGILWGLIGLSNASLLLLLPASMAWILWPMRRWFFMKQPIQGAPLRTWRLNLGRQILGVALCSATFWLALTPWIVRNERALHAFVPTRANFGVELWQSSHFDWWGPLPWGGAMPMWPGDPEFQRYARIGEVAYAREKGEIAQRTLRARPDLFLKFTAERLQMFWGGTPHPEDNHPVNEFFRMLNYSVLSVAGLLGLFLALHRRVEGAGLLGLAFLLAPAVYYGVTVQPRFRHPLEPLIAILGVYLFRAAEPRQNRQPLQTPASDAR